MKNILKEMPTSSAMGQAGMTGSIWNMTAASGPQCRHVCCSSCPLPSLQAACGTVPRDTSSTDPAPAHRTRLLSAVCWGWGQQQVQLGGVLGRSPCVQRQCGTICDENDCHIAKLQVPKAFPIPDRGKILRIKLLRENSFLKGLGKSCEHCQAELCASSA